MLQLEHRVRVEQVVLALAPPLVLAADLELAVCPLVGPVQVGQLMPRSDVGGDVVEVDAAHRAAQPGEVLVEHGLRDTDRLEQLRAGVGGDRGDAHLRHHLQHALAGGLDVVRQRLLAGDVTEQAPVDHVADRLEGHIGVDRPDTEADQHRHVVHLAGVTGLDDQTHLSPGALAHQMVVHGRDRQQRRDRRVRPVGLAIAQNQDPRPAGDGLAGRRPDVVEGATQAGPALGHRVEALDDRRAHLVPVAVDHVVGVQVDQLGQLVIPQDGLRQ